MKASSPPLSLYVHLPFCFSKCAYCDFNSQVAARPVRARYLEALLTAIEQAAPAGAGRTLQTIYCGGGTPTLYDATDLCAVLRRVQGCFKVARKAEVSLEANPGTVTPAGLALLCEVGFNRLSLGVQSLNDDELKLLGRGHSAAQAARAVAAARAAGFDNLSLDLINALPGQTPAAWERTLHRALSWKPEHLSCYGLSVPEGTPLATEVAAGRLALPDEETAVAIYELTHDRCTAAGYEHYEIANYAQPGYPCRHSLNYWANGEYLGIGAGAWSYLGGERLRHEPDPASWAEQILSGAGPAVTECETLDRRSRAGETLMLALRTAEGLDLRAFALAYGLDLELLLEHKDRLVAAGLARDLPERLALDPRRGFLMQSEIAAQLL
jgi:oxygen-independent coproporphyrinogen III oxidase